jgi:hypothetical protein
MKLRALALALPPNEPAARLQPVLDSVLAVEDDASRQAYAEERHQEIALDQFVPAILQDVPATRPRAPEVEEGDPFNFGASDTHATKGARYSGELGPNAVRQTGWSGGQGGSVETQPFPWVGW